MDLIGDIGIILFCYHTGNTFRALYSFRNEGNKAKALYSPISWYICFNSLTEHHLDTFISTEFTLYVVRVNSTNTYWCMHTYMHIIIFIHPYDDSDDVRMMMLVMIRLFGFNIPIGKCGFMERESITYPQDNM